MRAKQCALKCASSFPGQSFVLHSGVCRPTTLSALVAVVFLSLGFNRLGLFLFEGSGGGASQAYLVIDGRTDRRTDGRKSRQAMIARFRDPGWFGTSLAVSPPFEQNCNEPNTTLGRFRAHSSTLLRGSSYKSGERPSLLYTPNMRAPVWIRLVASVGRCYGMIPARGG